MAAPFDKRPTPTGKPPNAPPGARLTPAELKAREAAARRAATRRNALLFGPGTWTEIRGVSDMRDGWSGIGSRRD